MKTFKSLLLAVLSALFIVSCSSSEPAVLTGKVDVEGLDAMQVVYSFNGSTFLIRYAEIVPEEDGTYRFELQLPKESLDVDIYVNNDIFGAHLVTGTTTTVNIRSNEDGTIEAAFEGENAELSNVYNCYTRAYDIMKYFAMDPAESKTFAEYRAIADAEYEALKPVISALTNPADREYYTRLSEGSYDWTKIRIMMDEAFEINKKISEYEEYNELVDKVDPNDPINVETEMLSNWFGREIARTGYEESSTEAYLAAMDIADEKITEPRCREMLAAYLGYSYFLMGSQDGQTDRFWERFKVFAKDYPEIIAQYESQANAEVLVVDGGEVPYSPVMTDPDGKQVNLSDLKGKFTYIDIWATWCGPCRKEIPHLEKVVEHFKGNDNVLFLSISVDNDHDAWLKMITEDQPAWPQYILSREESDKFMTAWGISGIPRFIMLDKDGRIFSGDAIRPSDPAIIETIEAQIK